MQVSPEKSFYTDSGREVARSRKRLFNDVGHSADIDHWVEYINWSPCSNGVPGPRTHQERYAWMKHIWDRLSDEQRNLLLWNLQNLSASSAFSGLGGFEMILYCIWLEVSQHAPGLDPTSTFTSCDNAKWCQQMLMHYGEKHRTKHLGTDILDRLPEDVRAEVDGMLPEEEAATVAKRFAYAEVVAVM